MANQMDFTSHYHNQLLNRFTDIELTLRNISGLITFNLRLHKIILSYHSEFFLRMFTFNNNQTSFDMIVENVDVYHAVIMAMYGIKVELDYPKWMLTLKTIQCYNYLRKKVDMNQLYNLIVPSEGFELLMDVISEFDFLNDNKLLRVIRKNLPMPLSEFELFFGDNNVLIEKLRQNRRLIASVYDCTINIWDVDCDEEITKIHKLDASDIVTFSPDNTLMAYVEKDNICIYNCLTLKHVGTLSGHGHSPYAINFSRNGKEIVSTNFKNKISHWNVETISHIKSYSTDQVFNHSIFSPDCTKIAYIQKSNIYIYDIVANVVVHELNGHCEYIYSVVFSADNTKIVSCGSDRSIKIWNSCNGLLIRSIKNAHDKWIYNVAISPDGTKIASGGGNYLVKIWNADTYELLYTLTGHNDYAYVTFSPDNKQIISGDISIIRIWNADTGALIRYLPAWSGILRQIVYSN